MDRVGPKRASKHTTGALRAADGCDSNVARLLPFAGCLPAAIPAPERGRSHRPIAARMLAPRKLRERDVAEGILVGLHRDPIDLHQVGGLACAWEVGIDGVGFST